MHSIVRQIHHDLNQYPLMEDLEMGQALFFGLTRAPVFKLPKQFRVFNVWLAVIRGLGFFSFFSLRFHGIEDHGEKLDHIQV